MFDFDALSRAIAGQPALCVDDRMLSPVERAREANPPQTTSTQASSQESTG